MAVDDAVVEALFSNATFSKRFDQAVQKRTDKRMTNLETQYKAFKDGTGSVQAVREAVAELEADQPASVTPGRATPQTNSADDFKQQTAAILAEAGIDPTDPELAQLVATPVKSQAEWYLKVGQMAARRNPAPVATPGQVVMDVTGRAAGGQEEKLNRLYGELAEAQRTSDEPARMRLTKEIKALGGLA